MSTIMRYELIMVKVLLSISIAAACCPYCQLFRRRERYVLNAQELHQQLAIADRFGGNTGIQENPLLSTLPSRRNEIPVPTLPSVTSMHSNCGTRRYDQSPKHIQTHGQQSTDFDTDCVYDTVAHVGSSSGAIREETYRDVPRGQSNRRYQQALSHIPAHVRQSTNGEPDYDYDEPYSDVSSSVDINTEETQTGVISGRIVKQAVSGLDNSLNDLVRLGSEDTLPNLDDADIVHSVPEETGTHVNAGGSEIVKKAMYDLDKSLHDLRQLGAEDTVTDVHGGGSRRQSDTVLSLPENMEIHANTGGVTHSNHKLENTPEEVQGLVSVDAINYTRDGESLYPNQGTRVRAKLNSHSWSENVQTAGDKIKSARDNKTL